jgi:hypothetical protein
VHVLVLAAAADETRQTITILIACLVGIALSLAGLTVWYWFATSPRRRSMLEAEATAAPDPDLLEPEGDTTPVKPPPPESAPVSGRESVGGVEEGDPVVPAQVGEARSAISTWDFVAAARQAEEGIPAAPRPSGPPNPRIAVPSRSAATAGGSDEGDELARARRRRERQGEGGLSDEAWASVMRSAFDKLER